MAKLKLGKDFEITGNTTEIKDLLTNIGLDKKEIIKYNGKKKGGLLWVIIPSVLFFVIVCLIYTNAVSTKYLDIVDMASFFIFFWGIIAIHLKFKKSIVTGISLAAGIIILLLARHYLTPLEATKKIQEKFDNSSIGLGNKADTTKPKTADTTKKK